MNEALHNRIAAYFNNELNENDRLQLEDERKNNPEIAAAFTDYTTILRASEHLANEELRNEMNAWAKDERRYPFNNYWVLATIIGFLLIVSISTYVKISKIDPVELGRQYAVVEPIATVRNNNFTPDSLVNLRYHIPLQQANQFMEEKQYSEMRNALQQITIQSTIPQENKEWMLALSYYLENGRKDPQFLHILNKILDNTNHQNYQPAVDLDAKVNNFWGRLKG